MNPRDPSLPPPGGAAPAEDANSQALAGALRSSFFIVKIIMVALVMVFLGSGFFTVGPQEQAIILRLGKPVGEGKAALLNPGPHWAWPSPIDEVIKLHITSLTNADSTVGWYLSARELAGGATEPATIPSSLNPASSSYVLTADTNIIHVRASAYYHITDPIAFHFGFSDAPAFITNALNNALLVASSEFRVDGILTSNRAAFRERVQQQVSDLTESQKLGVSVDQVDVDSSPPLHLREKFNAVDQAMIKRDNLRNGAQTYQTTNVANARGDAATRVLVAEAARKRMVDMIAAQAGRFQKLRGEYERNPELFKRIGQMIVLEEVYTNAQDKILVPPNSRELRLNLSREPQAPSTANIPTQP